MLRSGIELRVKLAKPEASLFAEKHWPIYMHRVNAEFFESHLQKLDTEGKAVVGNWTSEGVFASSMPKLFPRGRACSHLQNVSGVLSQEGQCREKCPTSCVCGLS
jgi:hypothetical protein